MLKSKFVTWCLFFVPVVLLASPLTVQSYSMFNGGTGSFVYQDTSYLPCPASDCTTTGAFLSGGTGQLTNGTDSTRDWDLGEPEGWVGWEVAETDGLDPTVTFFFSSTVTIHSVFVWFDNTLDGGGVGAPADIVVDGTSYVPPQETLGPQGFTISGLDITGTSVDVQFLQEDPWIMIGQVSFNGTPSTVVPEPATLLLMFTGLAALGLLRNLRQRKQRE